MALKLKSLSTYGQFSSFKAFKIFFLFLLFCFSFYFATWILINVLKVCRKLTKSLLGETHCTGKTAGKKLATMVAIQFFLVFSKGSSKNYFDKILAFFEHLPSAGWQFWRNFITSMLTFPLPTKYLPRFVNRDFGLPLKLYNYFSSCKNGSFRNARPHDIQSLAK